MRRAILQTLSFTALLTAALSAAPVNSTEPPDRAGAGGPTYILDVGTNVIQGSASGCPNCGGDYQDNFSLTLPAGMTITSSFLTGSYSSGGGINPSGSCFTGEGCFYTGFGTGLASFTGTKSFTATSPFSFDQAGSELAGVFDYTLTVNVEATTPEPASGLLAIPALAAMLWRRRLNHR